MTTTTKTPKFNLMATRYKYFVGASALLFSGNDNIKALRLEVPDLRKEFSDTQFIGTGAIFGSVRFRILMTSKPSRSRGYSVLQ
jgi:hypothetical protein